MQNFNLKKKILNLKFDKKKLTSTIYRDCIFDGIVFDKCTFNKSEFWKVSLSNTIFKNCKFTNTLFSDIEFQGCKFINCKFVNIGIAHTNIYKKIFLNCSFKEVKLNTVVVQSKNYFPKEIIKKNISSIITLKEKNSLIKQLDNKGYSFKKNLKKISDNSLFNISHRHYVREVPQKFIKTKFSFKLKEKKYNINSLVKELVYGNGFVVLDHKSNIKEILKASKKIPYNKNLNKFSINKRDYQFYLNNLFKVDDSFGKILPQKKVFDNLEKILGENFVAGFYGANVLNPGARGQPFHIDYPYATMERKKGKLQNFSYKNPINIQLQIMLNQVNEKKGVGPTDIVPGSQLLQQDPKSLEIYENLKKKEIYFMNNKKKYKYKIKSLEGKRGTMILFNGLAWHRAGDNMSKKFRRITLNMQILSNYIRPQHKFNNIKKSKSEIVNKLSGYNLTLPTEV